MSSPTAPKNLTDLQRIGVTWSIQGGYEWCGRNVDRRFIDFLLACQADNDLVAVLRARMRALLVNVPYRDTVLHVQCA